MAFLKSSRSFLSKFLLASIPFTSSVFSQTLPDYAQRNLATIQKIYNITVYPNNVDIVNKGASAVPEGLFNQNAVGRVSPVGNFSGFDDSIEYFFGLAPVPNEQQGNIAIYQADVVNFISACPEVATSLVYLRTGRFDPETGERILNGSTTTLSQVSTAWNFAIVMLTAYRSHSGALTTKERC